MGYLTQFNLKVIGQTDIAHEEEISDQYYDGWPVFEESSKWYTYQEDMKEYSIQYPELLFRLEGWGEDRDDMWVCYFKNGKMQKSNATISFEEFDESKLI